LSSSAEFIRNFKDVMKALKILAGTIATMLLAIAIFYVGWLRAPSADEVCDNLDAITRKETGTTFGAREECIRRAQPPEAGRVPWVKRMKCMRNAGSLKELEACK
jgi:hypothetical protein